MMKNSLPYLSMILFMPTAVFASDETPHTTDVLTIWASASAANPDTISHAQMQSLNKYNAATAISTLPGVVLEKSGNRNELTVKVRGFDSRQVPVFFDGIPSYVPYDGNLDLGRFMTTELANIEVSKGYTSLLQGPNLMGGAINLTTILPTQPLAANLSFKQGLARGADNAYNANARLATRNESGFMQLSASRFKQRFLGLPTADDNTINAGHAGRRDNSAADDKRGMIKLGWTPRALDQYVLTYIKQDGSKASPPTTGVSKGQYRYWQWPDYNKESLYVNGMTQLSDNINLQSRFYHDKFINTLLMYKKNASLAPDYSHYDDYSNGAALQLAIDMREIDLLSFSAHWKDDIHRAQKQRAGEWLQYKDRTYSVATEYQWSIAPDLDAVGAIGYDWRNSRQAVLNTGSNDQQAFNWEMLLKYRLANEDLVRFSIADRSRFPTQKERYTTEKPKDNSVGLVNPHLQPERALIYDITYEGKLASHWQYQASLYYNRVSDAIMAHTIIKEGQPFFQNQNSGRVDYVGLDLSVQGEINAWLKTGINYSYIDSDPKQIHHVDGLPKHKLFAWVEIQPVDTVTITVTQELRASSYNYTDSNERVAGFAKSDWQVEYRLGNGMSINFAVNNLFDQSYQFTNGYIEEGRNFWLGMAYNY